MSVEFDCRRCGACCAAYRVSFYWAEIESRGLPAERTEAVTPLLRCMAGTQGPAPRCTALAGRVGESVTCTLYEARPSPCRELQPGDPQCLRARARHGVGAPAAGAALPLTRA